MRRLGLGCCTFALFFALFASSAWAIDIIESQEPGGKPETAKAGWQAGVCTEDPGTQEVIDEETATREVSPKRCSAETPQLFFKQPAGHPGSAVTQITVKHDPTTRAPVGDANTLFVELPTGLSVNPQATPTCELVVNENGEEELPEEGGQSLCPPESQVGVSIVYAYFDELGSVLRLEPRVYNLKPRPGEPARFGFPLLVKDVFLNAGVAYQSDYHEYFTIHVPKILPSLTLLTDRLIFDGTTGQEGGGGAFVTLPSTCGNPETEPFHRAYATTLHADSLQEMAPEDGYDLLAPAFPPPAFLASSQEVVSFIPKGAQPEGCGAIPFEPTVTTTAGTTSADSPAPATIEATMPYDPHADIYQSNVKTAKLTLPAGMGLNPAAAPGLGTCTEAQFGKGTRGPDECPAGSRLGSVSIETPVLPKGTLTGSAYLAAPEGRDPESGKLYRLFLDASSAERGVAVRLVAAVSANKQTGQLTATIEEAPQLPFTSFAVKLDGKPTAPLTSPSVCGPNPTTHAFEPWSGGSDNGPTQPGFELTGSPAGGACAKTGAERPFSPAFAAGPANTATKASTGYHLTLERRDGEQELKGLEVTLPLGTTARLKGVAYCSAAAIASAEGQSARDEIAHPSCPETSFVGTVKAGVGSGSTPLSLPGNAYLSGPYKGAPLSMVIVTPALAGPFDLGNVVVRAALFVDPVSGQVKVVSDPIPDVIGGAKVDLRSLAVDVSRSYFVRNGTSCDPTSVTGSVAGGGNEPWNPAAFSSHAVSAGAQTTGCEALGFKPRLNLSLSGPTRRTSQPHLHAELRARSQKDADISALSVALPHALFLDQSSLKDVCTRVQFAAAACPQRSIYGHATAYSPLLDEPLSGYVYLRSSDNKLPDLVAHLQGQVGIDLVGRIDSWHGGIRTSFEGVPDLPVSRFVLDLPGGKSGLLVASRDLCAKPVEATVKAKAHNGKKADLSSVVKTSCKTSKKSKGKGKG